jgi:hypothetical protein
MSLIRLLLIVTLTFPALASAAQFYRWVDEEGNLFIQNSIPPKYVKKGYEIIDEHGNVIQKIAPEMTEEERQALLKEEADNEEARLNSEMRQAQDEELLKQYRKPTDVDRAMKTALSQVDMAIQIKRNHIRVEQNSFDQLQAQAAISEKAGREVDASILEKMESFNQKIDQYNQDINQLKIRRDQIRDDFVKDRKRMIILWEMRTNETWVEPETDEKTQPDT